MSRSDEEPRSCNLYQHNPSPLKKYTIVGKGVNAPSHEQIIHPVNPIQRHVRDALLELFQLARRKLVSKLLPLLQLGVVLLLVELGCRACGLVLWIQGEGSSEVSMKPVVRLPRSALQKCNETKKPLSLRKD